MIQAVIQAVTQAVTQTATIVFTSTREFSLRSDATVVSTAFCKDT